MHLLRWVKILFPSVLFDGIRRWPLTVVNQLGVTEDELSLDYLFWVPLHVEQAVLSLEKAAWSFSVLPADAVVSRSTSDVPNS